MEKYVEELLECLEQLWALEERIKAIRAKLVEEHGVDLVGVVEVSPDAT